MTRKKERERGERVGGMMTWMSGHCKDVREGLESGLEEQKHQKILVEFHAVLYDQPSDLVRNRPRKHNGYTGNHTDHQEEGDAPSNIDSGLNLSCAPTLTLWGIFTYQYEMRHSQSVFRMRIDTRTKSNN